MKTLRQFKRNGFKISITTMLAVIILPLTGVCQRVVDLKFEDLIEPTRIEHEKNIQVEFALKNMGPDEVREVDTLVYRFNLNNTLQTTQIARQVGRTLAKGDTMHISVEFNSIQVSGASFQGSFCGIAAVINRSLTDSLIWEENNTTYENNRLCENVDYIDEHGWSVGIGEIKWSEMKLNVFPNPVADHFTVAFNNFSHQGDVSIKLFDLNGNLLREILNENLLPGNHTVAVDRGSLPAGVYTVSVESLNQKAVGKVVIL